MSELQISGKIKNTPQLFVFPEDSIGIQHGKTFDEVIQKVMKKFTDTFGQNSDIKWPYNPSSSQYPSNLEYTEFLLRCRKCSSILLYKKRTNFQIIYRLVKMDRHHPHNIDEKNQRELNHLIRSQKLLNIDKYEKTSEKLNRIRHERSKINNLEEFIRRLPHGLLNDTKAQLAQQHFGISYSEYYLKVKTIESEYEKNAVELFEHFKKCGYDFSYLPTDIAQKNQIILANRQQEQKIIQQMNINKVKAYERLNPKHWNLPNVMLIVTPQMKELYRRYGQWVGFDLTFSLIKEVPESTQEYLIGVFGGTSQSQRIAVYGLVITNNQTVEIYKYLFHEFIKIMGKEPQTFITDEQKSIYYALKQLKDERKFHGYHLFDTFHILKKFRKASGYQGDNFQLFRQLIHAKNRRQYKQIFEKVLDSARNDAQLEIIRSFDYNNSMYCISQIQKTYVGAGISDSPCEKIHDIIKQEIPHQVNYIKGIMITLDVLRIRNNMLKYGFIEHFPVEERLNMPFLKPYRLMLSRGIFKTFVKEISKSAAYRIRNSSMDHFSTFKQQHLESQLQKRSDREILANTYFVDTKMGSFTVTKEHSKFPNEHKWKCQCQYEDKTGIPCSHIAKVLLYTGENFYNNLHPRWFIKQDELTENSKNYGSKIKYLNPVRKNRKKRTDKDSDQFSDNLSESVHSVNFQDNISCDTVSTMSRLTSKADLQATGDSQDEVDLNLESEVKDPEDLITQPIEINSEKQGEQNQQNEEIKLDSIFPVKKMLIPHLKRQKPQRLVRFSRWTPKQKENYLKFIITNFELMKREDRTNRFLKFKMMSKFIKTRSRMQCQSYHKDKLEKHRTLENIIIEFKTKQQEEESQF